jgi:hypothetical protein
LGRFDLGMYVPKRRCGRVETAERGLSLEMAARPPGDPISDPS